VAGFGNTGATARLQLARAASVDVALMNELAKRSTANNEITTSAGGDSGQFGMGGRVAVAAAKRGVVIATH